MPVQQIGIAMGTFRKASWIAVLIGGAGSVILMLLSGLRPPVFLIILFIGWVLAPFLSLSLGLCFSRRFPMLRRTLYWLTPVVALGSLAIYTYVLVRPLPSQPAFPYVAVPIGSGVLIVVVLSISALPSRSKSTRVVDNGR